MRTIFYAFRDDKTSIAFKAMENHLAGSGNPLSVAHACNNIQVLFQDNPQPLKNWENDIDSLLAGGAIVVVYGESNWLCTHSSKSNIDFLVIQHKDSKLFVKGFQGRESVSSTLVLLDSENEAGNLDNVIGLLQNHGYRGFNHSNDCGIYGITKDRYLVPDFDEFPSSWIDEGTFNFEKELDITPEVTNTNNAATINPNTFNTGEVKMTKVATVLNANKAAVVNVAKIEAGRIAVKQAVKLVKPAVPMMARGYLDTAIGELVVANLFKFAVDNFAANNQKAQVVADAMLQGAMLGTIQSLNIEQMIAEVMEKVDFTKFTDIEN